MKKNDLFQERKAKFNIFLKEHLVKNVIFSFK